MNPIYCLRPDFLRDFHATRHSVLAGHFEDVRNDVDGVVYPAINRQLPMAVQQELVQGIEFMLQRRIDVRYCFARAMYEGMQATNKIHSDRLMGTTLASQLYLSEHWPEGAGTTFWSHKRYGMQHTDDTPVHDVDCNDLQQFERMVSVQARPNLLLVHRGDVWHLAEPIGGWGTEPANARLVVTCFFNLA